MEDWEDTETWEGMQKRHWGYHQEHVSMNLTWSGIDDERAAYLGDYTNVVRDLANHDPDDWGLVRAAMLHILHSKELVFEHNRGIGQEIIACFKHKAQQPLYYLTLDTWRNQPNPQFGREEIYHEHQLTSREATYYYSRAALAVLISDSEPKQAVELFENVKTIFGPRVHYRLPGGDDGLHGGLYPYLVLERLPVLYERVERFEDALNLAPISFDHLGVTFHLATLRSAGWRVG